ncbi:MAG: PDZ domain-containing protein [Candidatus Thiodiazotropha sp.]
MVDYTLKLYSPNSHQFLVELYIENPDPDGQVVYLPAWIRGSYMIRDYARNIITIEAFNGSGAVNGQKLDKQTWQFDSVEGPLTIKYLVYAWELTVRTSHFDATHAYFNGPCLFLAVSSQEKQQCRLNVEMPTIPDIKSWRVATGMRALNVDANGFGQYESDSYEDLIDYPFEIGEFTDHDFTVGKKSHRLVVSGMPSLDLEPVCEQVKKICEKQVELFGEQPAENYLFMLRITGGSYGGLEHRNSTSLIFPRHELFARNKQDITSGYRRLLALCSHEYFHQWHVKRITPEVFQKNGTDREVHTRQLWVFEGITSYYDELMLVRSGVIDAESYLEMLAETVTRVMRANGRTKQTLEESSFDAWTKFYKQDENAPNALVSYYSKGALLALVIDLTIRLESHGKHSLDDIMRYLWTQYGKPGVGLPEGVMEHILTEVSGVDLRELLDLGLRSTEDLPLEHTLSEFGVQMKLIQARSSEDLGGVVKSFSTKEDPHIDLGAKLADGGQVIRIVQVFDDGPAQAAGLAPGDEIVAVDNLRMNVKQLENYLADTTPGDCILVHFFRRDEMMAVQVTPSPAKADTCYFHLPDDLSVEKRSRLNQWLYGHE